MGPIEDLNFAVIVNDEAFKDKLGELENRAKRFNESVTNYLDFSKVMKVPEGTTASLEKVEEKTKKISENTENIAENQKEHTSEVKNTNTALSGTESLLRTLEQLTGVAFSVVTIRRFVSELVNVTGQFEVQKMALGSMLQDLDKADKIFSQLRKDALNSPYTFQDLTKFAKQLTAFNIPTEQLVETERRLADVAAGLGVDMGRIILAYGQVKAAGALKGQELRQFTEAGVPILEQLAKQIEEVEGKTISLSEVFNRVTKKQISFEMVEEAFRRMTSEGGKFYNMQQVLVETLQGKIGKLRDVWQQALYDIGTSNDSFLKGAVDAITKIVANLDELGKRIPELVTAWGAYKAVQIAVDVATVGLNKSNIGLLKTFRSIGQWISKNPYAILAAAIAAITIEAVRFGKQAYESTHRVQIAQKEFNEAIATTTKNISSEREELRKLTMIAGNELNTMKQRTDAIDVINAQYSEYLNNLGLEKVSIDNLGKSYNVLRDAIANKYLEELREQTVGKQQAASADARAGLNAFNAAFLRNTGITIGENAGKKYGPGGIGLIQGEIERFIDEHPMFDKEALTNAIANIYRKYGLEISAGSKAAGDLYKVVEDYVEAASLLASAERDFDNFAKGYGKSLGMLSGESGSVSNEGVNAWGNDWNPIGGKSKMPIIDIEKVIEEVDKELLGTLKKDTAELDKELDKRLKAMNSWDAFMDKWEHTKGGQEGEGPEFKLTGFIQDWEKADYSVLEEYRKHLEDLRIQFDENSKSFKNAKKELDEWRKTMEQTNRNKLVEQVRGLADDIMKKGLGGYTLSDWSDKSLSQINEMREIIQKMDIPDNIKKELSADSDLLETLINEFERLREETIENTIDPELFKKYTKYAKYAANQIKSLASSFGRLGEAIGNARLSDAADSIQTLGDFASDVSSGYSQAGVAGAVIGALVSMAKIIVNDIAAGAEQTAEATERANKAAVSYAQAIRKAAIDSHTTIFGTDDVGKYREFVKIADKYRKILEGIREIVDTQAPGLLEALGYSDENGNIDLERIKAELEAGTLKSDELLDMINSIEEAQSGIDSIMETLFGDIASSAADQIVESWIAAGDAALDYADILDDVAKSYAKMLIQSLIMENYLDPITKDLKSAFVEDRYEDAMAMIAGAMEGIANSAPMFEQILSAFDPYFNTGDSTNSVGNGIKSITEDTANLLASYINAIRQDVSVIRGLQERGFASIDVIGQTIPTLNDYMNQVAANTFDTAQNTQQILGELQSVIGAEGSSGSIVRVQVA